jgi:hypothetical protein
MSASAPPRGAFSNQLLQKVGFFREGANPVRLRTRPPMLAKGAKQNLQRGAPGTLRKTLRINRTGFSPSTRTLCQNSGLSSDRSSGCSPMPTADYTRNDNTARESAATAVAISISARSSGPIAQRRSMSSIAPSA